MSDKKGKKEEISEEERQVQEALVRQGTTFLLDNEMATADQVINDLMMASFACHNGVQDVDIYVDDKKKEYKIVLSFGWWRYMFINALKLEMQLNIFVKSGMSKWTVVAEKKRYSRDSGTELGL